METSRSFVPTISRRRMVRTTELPLGSIAVGQNGLAQASPALTIPVDDGACDHLRGMRLPRISLRGTTEGQVDLSTLRSPWVVVYVYPRTGLPWEKLERAMTTYPEQEAVPLKAVPLEITTSG